MKKVNENKGFTLAELLIVVAIIAVMVAIAIPTFADQIEKSREATDLANIRSAYSDVVVRSLSDPDNDITATVTAKQTVQDWQSGTPEVAGATIPNTNAKSGGSFTIAYTKSDGKIKIEGEEVKAATSITTGGGGATKTASAATVSGSLTKASYSLTGDAASFTSDILTVPMTGLTFGADNYDFDVADAKKDDADTTDISIDGSNNIKIENATAAATYTFTLQIYADGESPSTHNPKTQSITIEITA